MKVKLIDDISAKKLGFKKNAILNFKMLGKRVTLENKKIRKSIETTLISIYGDSIKIEGFVYNNKESFDFLNIFLKVQF